MKRPRVLHLLGSFEIGGTEVQAVRLLRSLSTQRDLCTSVGAISGAGPLRTVIEDAGYRTVAEFPLTSFRDANFIKQSFSLAGYLKRNAIDLLHTHDFYSNILGMASARLANTRCRLASKRATWSKTGAQLLVERQAFRFAHKIVANSDAVREFLIEGGVPGAKIATIYNGLDPSRFVERRVDDRHEWQDKLGLDVDPEARLVTIVANMRSDVKNHEMFLRSAKLIGAEENTAIFVLVGEGELEAEFRQMAGELGIGGRCRFLGGRSDVREILSVSDVGVLCSRSEGFANAILEYMAAGLPVVATDVGGAREAVEHERTGFVIPASDVTALASSVLALLNDAEMSTAMGERGRAIAAERFSESAQLEAVISLYDSLLNG
ncbi:MAG: glycosyltransferase [Acidobacteria bacterium]|nr:glycosyltransferase [Acidobacteriota bacterium]